MPPRKSRDKEVQPAQADHADDSPLHFEGENDPITFLPVSPLAERSYGNPVFKEKEADRGGDFAESSNMFRGQRQHEPMEAAAPVADHGHQPQHRYVPPGKRGNVGPHHQPYPRDFFQPQVPLAQPVQRGLQNHPAQLFNRDQLIDLVQETYGPALRPLVRPAYRKPYPNIIDHENPFPRGFKVPKFTLFSGEVGQSTIEHIGHCTIQCGEASGDDNLKLRLFPSSLTGTALTWYLMARYENLLKEDVQKKAASHGTYYSDPNFDLDVAEVVTDKPVFCPDLVRPPHQPETSVRRYVGEAGKQYTFDVSKASDIFDHLKKSGLIKLPPGHKIPIAAEIEARDYCKFHNSWKHSTDNCLIFRNILQEKIDKGILKFPDKAKETMGVDVDPFPAVSVGVNVVDLKSVARNRSLPFAQRNLAAEDLRWVLEAQRSRHSRSVRSDQQRLGGQERIIVTRNFSPEGARWYSTGTRSPRMVKPPLRLPSKRWEKVNHPKFPAQNPRTLRCRLQRKRAEERKRQQKQVEAEGSSSRRPRQPTKRNMVWVRKEKKEAVT
ncbi:hypothetical protein SLEP1_g22840 [Rubroshorea leprosula]|uniref:Uncharacterized protein n=1 Tax=Rubroshorea leprosula TaxID=152421 RepID=A0AAV5JGJ9_9ROSI|nr:hypothetical protein SLEP1_g22840 [Rubroshorea leprosula]